MKSFFKNAFLIIALSLAILMIIGICLYEYIPNNSSFAEANTYVTNAKTLKILAEITNDENLNEDGESTGSNVILKEYTVTQADLATYIAKKDYQKGKTNPFSSGEAPVTNEQGNANTAKPTENENKGTANQTGNNTNTSSNGSSSSNGNSSNNVANDGTLLGSKNSK